MSIRRWTYVGTILSTVVAALTVCVGVGMADPPSSAPAIETITFVPTTTAPTTTNGAAQPALPVIVCELSPQNPHISSHNPEVINAIGSVSCSQKMVQLTLRVELKTAGLVVASTSGQNFGESSLSKNVTTPGCVSGEYTNEVSFTATAPPGYAPAGQAGDLSNTQFITC